ncbi:hypothetical protein QT970_15820, partial [Microcoleus sp. herbarium8]|uniref:hypothetical protein n=1 Tax=Microcoleus sp. herbarium8 TaxID=3055436 RepID=UPI002FCF119D
IDQLSVQLADGCHARTFIFSTSHLVNIAGNCTCCWPRSQSSLLLWRKFDRLLQVPLAGRSAIACSPCYGFFNKTY